MGSTVERHPSPVRETAPVAVAALGDAVIPAAAPRPTQEIEVTPAGSGTEPLYFTSAESQVFAWFHPARGSTPRDAAVLLCNPLGHEALSTHRTLRRLAETLSGEGFAVMRFDYPGTGDSSGSDADPGRVVAWMTSIGRAISELQGRSGCRRVAVVGVRFGATLAALAAADRNDVPDLVLVAPCVSGRGYLRELRAFQGAMALPEPPADATIPEGAQEAAGFLFSAETVESLEHVSLSAARVPGDKGVLLIERDDMPTDARVARACASWDATVETRRLPGYAGMMADPHKAVVPTEVVGAILGWLVERHPPQTLAPAVAVARKIGVPRITLPVRAEPLPSTQPNLSALSGQIEEQPIYFGEDGRMFGIITRPPRTMRARETGIVLLNSGAVHRVGCNRMWVTWARAWAALGYNVLRVDVAGLGDSPAHDGHDENVIYAPHAVADVRHAVDALRTFSGVHKVVLSGLCSGAYLAFHGALAGDPVVGAMLINPATFYFQPGMSLDVTPAKAYRMTTHYKQAFFRKETWGKLVRGQIDLHLFARSVAIRSRDLASAKAQRLLRWARIGTGARSLDGDMRRLADAAQELLFVFAAGEPGLEAIRLGAERTFKRLCNDGQFRLEVLDSTDHTFTPVWSQNRLLGVLTAHLLERHG